MERVPVENLELPVQGQSLEELEVSCEGASQVGFESVDSSWSSEGAQAYQEGGVVETGIENQDLSTEPAPYSDTGVEMTAAEGQSLQGEEEVVQKKQGLFERFRRSSLAVKAGSLATAAALTLGVANHENEPAKANPTAAASAARALGPNALKKLCKTEALKMPKVTEARMYNPGRRHNPRMQHISIGMNYGSLSNECGGRYRRFGQVMAQLQDPRHGGRWRRITWPKWYQTLTDAQDPNILGRNSAVATAANIGLNGHEPDYVYYRCTPGKRETHARFFIRNQFRDTKTHKVLGQKIRKYPIKISGGGC